MSHDLITEELIDIVSYQLTSFSMSAIPAFTLSLDLVSISKDVLVASYSLV